MHNTPISGDISLQMILDSCDEMVGVFDKNLVCHYYNVDLDHFFMKISGKPIEKGAPISNYVSSEFLGYWKTNFIKAFSGTVVKEIFPVSLHKKKTFYEITIKPLEKEGQVTNVACYVKDITEYKEIEKALTESEKRYRKLASNIPHADIFLLDKDLKVLIAVGQEMKKYGNSSEIFEGKSLMDISAAFGMEFLQEAYHDALNNIPVSLHLTYADNRYLLEMVPILNDEGERINTIMLNRNITEAQKAQEKLEIINQTKDSIMGVVAHDLRNPITAIMGLSDLIKSDLPNTQSYLELVDKSCHNALSIINDLLDITELDRDDYVLETDVVELNEFIREALQTHFFLADDKELQIAFDCNSSEIFVDINRDKFARVINNVIINSIKFSHRKSKINIVTQVNENDVVISVQDFGIGIPEHLQDKIFDKFTKAGRKGTEGEKSMGLGMSIVKQIVHLHKGRIWLESEENVGTTFYIQLKAHNPIQISNA